MRKDNLILGLTLVTAQLSWAGKPAKVLTIEDYTKKAVEEGVRGRLTSMTFEQAGYAREVVFRQTSLPTLTASHAHTRGETETGASGTVSDSKETGIELNETTPLGTVLNASGQYASSTNGSASQPAASASATQPLYLFVKNPVARSRRLAELTFADAKTTIDFTLLSLRSQARSLYYAVMQDAALIQVEQRKVASTQKLLDITQALVDAGKSAPVEVMRTKIRFQADQRQFENAQVSLEKSQLQAKNFALLSLEADLKFVTDLQFAPLKILLDRLVDYALLHRPQLQLLRRAQETALLSYQAALVPTRPALSLNGTYNYTHQDPAYYSRGWTWTGSANWMFFDSFVTSQQVRSARVGQLVADLNLLDGERSTRVSVRNSYLDIKRVEKQIDDFKFSRDQSKRNVDVIRLRFQNGLERIIDVFNAEDEMRNLDIEYLGLLVQFNQAKDQLSELVGVDVETLQ